MYKIASLIPLALAGLLLLPYLLYWVLWLITGTGRTPKSTEQPRHGRNPWRPQELWALRAVGVTAIAVGIYRATLFLWAR